jgi:hypothetical protein
MSTTRTPTKPLLGACAAAFVQPLARITGWNPAKIMLELIERAGSYFGHDDIICIEDEYQRS